MARLTALKQELADLEPLHKGEQAELDALLLRVPNVPAPEVPEGKDDADNVEIKRWGEPPRFDFEPRDHVDARRRPRAGSTSSAARASRARATTS